MINNQNLAVLSEKVAALEAAIKNAGIELPVVTSSDNGKTLQVVNGAWATGDKIPPENIVYISSTLSEDSDETTISYPTGLNNTNCMIMAFNIESGIGNDLFRMGEGAFSSSFTRLYAILNPSVISINTTDSNLRGRTIRIALLKI